MKILIIISLTIFLNNSIMAQQIESDNFRTINKGYVISNAVEIIGDTLYFYNSLSGKGNVSWFFEIENNKLVIVDFRWLVVPNTNVFMHSKYLRTPKSTINITPDLKYEFYYDKDYIEEKNWVSLTGEVNKNIKVDIKINSPYWTKNTDKNFIYLINKYNLKIKYKNW